MVKIGFERDHIRMYDKAGEKISSYDPSYNECAEMIKNAKFMAVFGDDGSKTLKWLSDEFKITFPQTDVCVGYFFYDNRTGKWEDAEELIEFACKTEYILTGENYLMGGSR